MLEKSQHIKSRIVVLLLEEIYYNRTRCMQVKKGTIDWLNTFSVSTCIPTNRCHFRRFSLGFDSRTWPSEAAFGHFTLDKRSKLAKYEAQWNSNI